MPLSDRLATRHEASVPVSQVFGVPAMPHGDFRTGVFSAGNFGRDADTIAAIRGAVLGGMYGCRTIPARWAEKARYPSVTFPWPGESTCWRSPASCASWRDKEMDAMTAPNIRLIATDLDGTFLGEDSRPLPQNAQAFRRAQEMGIHVCIASGRLANVCSRIAREMGLDGCHIIGMNGAQMLLSPFDPPVISRFFPDAVRDRCLSVIAAHGCSYNLYTYSGVYTNQRFTPEQREHFLSGFSGCGVSVVIGPDAAARALSLPCVKLLMKPGRDTAAYERARLALAAIPGVALTSSFAGATEIVRDDVSKAAAIGELARRLGIDMDEVMAFGDYDNDVEMLTACGLGVAMENGSPAALRAARLVTRPNVAAGVACAVNALLDGKLDLLSPGGELTVEMRLPPEAQLAEQPRHPARGAHHSGGPRLHQPHARRAGGR